MPLSYQSTTSTGTLTFIDIAITYLDRSEISVYFDDVLTTAWSWSGTYDKRVLFPSPVPNGVVVTIKRVTDASQLRHEFSRGAAFTSDNLDEDLKQALHIAQEAYERPNEVGTYDFYGNVNMHSNRIMNLRPAVDPQDAVTLQQLNEAIAEGGGGGGGGGGSALADLANSEDVAKGDALLAVKQPFTGGVARTQHEKNIDTGLYADDFRLAGDPDDSLSIQRVLNLGRTCLLRANKTYTAHGLVAVTGAALMCPNGEAKIVVPPGAGRFGLLCEVSNFTAAGIWFSGGAEATAWNVLTPPAIGDRDGIVVGTAFGTGAGLSNITLRNLRISGFDHSSLFGREVQVGMSFDKRVTIDNVIAYSSYVGLWYSPRFEYTTTTNSKGYRCYAGIIMQAGNNLVTASQFEENFENGQMAPGENDGHGSFVGCSFNHAIGIGLNAININNGHVFTGCQFWFAPIQLSNCTGIRITHSQIRYSAVTVTGGGLNMIDDNWVGAGGLPRTLVGATFTSFRRNRTTATDATVDEAFGDLFVSSNAPALGYPLAWNATSDTALTPAFEYLRYHGVESAFLNSGGRIYIPTSMRVHVSVRLIFSTGATAERPVLKVVRRSFGGTIMETAVASTEAAASRSECSIILTTQMLCNNGDSLAITLKSLTSTGITVAPGGFRLVVSSAID